MAKTKIEWTDTTWNPVVGCTRVSEGCRNCYAERMSVRIAAMACAAGRRGDTLTDRQASYAASVEFDGKKYLPMWSNDVFPLASALSEPLRWREPRMVFVNSMSDLFHEAVPFEFIDRVFAVMALCPQHTFQVLTKRPERMEKWCRYAVECDNFQEELDRLTQRVEGEPFAYRQVADGGWPIENVWLGSSAEDQATADARIPHLLRCPAAVRFLSCEPLLGPIDLGKMMVHKTGLGGHGTFVNALAVIPGRYAAGELGPVHWVIVGGESGPGARPMHPDWARSIRDQCAPGSGAGVPFFFKQWGAWRPCRGDDFERRRTMHYWNDDAGTWCAKVGKRAAGRLLDGVEHNGMPAPGSGVAGLPGAGR